MNNTNFADLNNHHSRNRSALKSVSIAGSILVYLSFVLYSEFHYLNIVMKFLPEESSRLFGGTAVAVTALTSIALPLAIHYWVRSGLQNVAAWIFYAAHLLFVTSNLIISSSANSGVQLESLFHVYSIYVLPASTALYAVGWIAIWAYDSASVRAEAVDDLRETLEDIEHGRKLTEAQIDGEIARAELMALKSALSSPEAMDMINRTVAARAPEFLARRLGITPIQDTSFDFWSTESADVVSSDASLTPPQVENNNSDEYVTIPVQPSLNGSSSKKVVSSD